MSETRLQRMEDQLDGYKRRARNAMANWERTTLRVVNAGESVLTGGILGKMEKEDVLQGSMFGLKIEHGVTIAAGAVALISDDETLQAHATAIATGAGTVALYKYMAE